VDHDDATAAGTTPDAADPNVALAKLLQEQLAAHEAQAPKDGAPPAEPTFFGMTMTAIFLGFAISTVGLGLANYGRTTGNIVFGVFGVAMMIAPFFLTSTWALVAAGVVLLGTPLLMKKLQMI